MATLRVLATTINDYVKGQEDLTTAKYGAIKFLKSKGRITFNNESHTKEWVVEYKVNTPTQASDGDTATFDRINYNKRASIGWRWQWMNEAVSKLEKEENKGASALVKIWENKISRMTDHFTRDLSKQFWLDGSDAGREQYLEGLQTVVNKATGATTDQYPTPTTSDSYANLVMAPGYYGGSAGGTYPDGQADPEYYFWMPFQTKYNHSGFGGTTWGDNCIEAVRATLAYVHVSRGPDSIPDMLWMSPKKWTEFANSQDEKERIDVSKSSDAVKLGFKSINFEGADLVMDYHVPEAGVFGFRADEIELASLTSQLFSVEKDKAIEDRTERIGLDFMGNMKLCPRSMTYLGDFA
jgi:hypothetical protein